MANGATRPARRGRPYWEHHINEWKRTGKSQAEYCRKHGLSHQLFSNWKRRLAGEEKEHQMQFVELPISRASDNGSRPLFEFKLDEDLRVSMSFKLAPEIIRNMLGGIE